LPLPDFQFPVKDKDDFQVQGGMNQGPWGMVNPGLAGIYLGFSRMDSQNALLQPIVPPYALMMSRD
jgi:hypothetical protein